MTALAVIVGIAIGAAIVYALGGQDRAAADEQFARAERMALSRKRAWQRLRMTRSRPDWLPVPTAGRFVAARPDDPKRLLSEAIQPWRERARARREQ